MQHIKLFEDFASSQMSGQQAVVVIPYEDGFDIVTTSQKELTDVNMDALNKSLSLPEFKVTVLPIEDQSKTYLKYSHGNYSIPPELISKSEAERLYEQTPDSMLATTDGKSFKWVETQDWTYADALSMWLIPVIEGACVHVNAFYSDIRIEGSASDRLSAAVSNGPYNNRGFNM